MNNMETDIFIQNDLLFKEKWEMLNLRFLLLLSFLIKYL